LVLSEFSGVESFFAPRKWSNVVASNADVVVSKFNGAALSPVKGEYFEESEFGFELHDDSVVKDFKDLDGDRVPEYTAGRDGVFERVGCRDPTNEKCGRYRRMKACLHTELHDLVTIDNGVNYHGKIFWRKQFHSCDSPACKICFKRGWAVDQAKAAGVVLEKASKGYVDDDGKKHQALGQIEHVIFGIPIVDYGLSFDKLKKLAIDILKSRGVYGGFFIFHAQRFANAVEARRKGVPFGWRFAPHIHCLGFIEGGYRKCRRCENSTGDGGIFSHEKCMACDGFEGRTRRLYDKEAMVKGVGYIVKVKAARRTVVGTLWYQLNHASFVRGSKRVKEVGVWFGVAASVK
jgi:hypothetical protein